MRKAWLRLLGWLFPGRVSAKSVAALEAAVASIEGSTDMQAGQLPEEGASIEAKANALKPAKKWETLGGLLRMAAKGEIDSEMMEEIIESLETLDGFNDRDRQLAAILEGAPVSLDEDPIFKQGEAKGFQAGYQKCMADFAKRAQEMELAGLLKQ